MAEHGEVGEVGSAAESADVRQPPAQVGFPHALLGGFGSEDHHPLVFVKHQPLHQHQPDEGFAQAHAVAEEGSSVLAGDLHQRPVGLSLVLIEVREHPRVGLVPFAGGELPAPEELVEGLGINVEGGELGGVAGDGSQHILGDFFGLFPVDVEPVLELGDFPAALDLDVQLDVLGQPGPGEVAGADQRLGTDHVELGVGYVGLGVELVPPVDPAVDLALLQRFDHSVGAL